MVLEKEKHQCISVILLVHCICLDKGHSPLLYKSESPSPKVAICKAWLKIGTGGDENVKSYDNKDDGDIQ